MDHKAEMKIYPDPVQSFYPLQVYFIGANIGLAVYKKVLEADTLNDRDVNIA